MTEQKEYNQEYNLCLQVLRDMTFYFSPLGLKSHPFEEAWKNAALRYLSENEGRIDHLTAKKFMSEILLLMKTALG